jgi:arylsulfatase A-like enzyme
LIITLFAAACSKSAPPPQAHTSSAPPRNLLIVTIDTLRPDHVGAYGDRSARTPALDALAAAGIRFEHAYATAPITLTSHASLMTGRYPAGHGARHNGMRMDLSTPTLADALGRSGFATAAFIAAFPLDRRFGLIKGFQTYGDHLGRDAQGRSLNERPGRQVVDEAIDWLSRNRETRFFLWVHLFEPHAPYGNPADPVQARRPPIARYDDDIAEADAQVGRLLQALGDARANTLIVAAGDHGEAFGEHGEISHSVFVYDTTLRVPLIFAGAGVARPVVVGDPVSLIDVAPTVVARLGIGRFDADGVDLSPTFAGGRLPSRALYAESFAPLLDFGWSPLRTVRSDTWKYIAAPKPELYDLGADPSETHNVIATNASRAIALAQRVDAFAPAALAPAVPQADRDTLARLQALGYASGRPSPTIARPDPKDRRALAARIAEVTSGELHGAALERALRDILKEDPGNPQANLRLGYLLSDKGNCAAAVPLFRRAIDGHLPSVDAHLGLAGCQASGRDLASAARTLAAAAEIEPDNPVVEANLGIMLSDGGKPADGIPHLQRALTLDPDLHQARFSLAIALARLGRRTDAASQAEDLLRRLPADAPQRPEVQRLLQTLR